MAGSGCGGRRPVRRRPVAGRRLAPTGGRELTSVTLPAGFATTRQSLHQVAFFALAPARYASVGRMGLCPSPGGYATPPFAGRVLRVELDMLVAEQPDLIATAAITTTREAARFCGVDYRVDWYDQFHDAPHPVDPDALLRVEIEAARALGDWFELGERTLASLTALADPAEEPSDIQLWPEHFDIAAVLGEEKVRATYGASPGDAAHVEPYFYVAPWEEVDRGQPFWNDTSFNGASLSSVELSVAVDPAEEALDFLLRGRELLRGH